VQKVRSKELWIICKQCNRRLMYERNSRKRFYNRRIVWQELWILSQNSTKDDINPIELSSMGPSSSRSLHEHSRIQIHIGSPWGFFLSSNIRQWGRCHYRLRHTWSHLDNNNRQVQIVQLHREYVNDCRSNYIVEELHSLHIPGCHVTKETI